MIAGRVALGLSFLIFILTLLLYLGTRNTSSEVRNTGDNHPSTSVTEEYEEGNKILLSSKVVSNIANDYLKQFLEKPSKDPNNVSISELVAKKGFAFKEYDIVTSDDYILKIFRIPKDGKEAVLIMHSMIGLSDDFFNRGSKNSIAYILADSGYDVWIGNVRGSKHSLKHLHLDTSDLKYWDFSLDELAMTDVRSMVDFIIRERKIEKIFYVGYSQGGTLISMLCSMRPDYNDKIKLAVLLAPAVRISKMTNKIKEIIKSADLLNDLSRANSDGEFISSISSTLSILTTIFCEYTFSIKLCSSTLLPLPKVSFSTRQLNHFKQIYDTSKFGSYDFGPNRNIVKYSSPVAPEYPLRNFTAPVMIAYSIDDDVVVPEDIKILRRNLPNVVEYYSVPKIGFGHADFTGNRDVKTFLMDRVIEIMRKFKNT